MNKGLRRFYGLMGSLQKRHLSLMFIILMMGVPVVLAGCRSENYKIDLEAEKKEVEKVIHISIGWAKNKDLAGLYQVIANDTGYLEVDPDDRIVRGFHDFKKAEDFWMSPDFKAIRYEIRDLVIRFSKQGDIAWFFCLLDDINQWKGHPANWENTRWTGVLEKQNGQWVIVQMHFSFAFKEK